MKELYLVFYKFLECSYDSRRFYAPLNAELVVCWMFIESTFSGNISFETVNFYFFISQVFE